MTRPFLYLFVGLLPFLAPLLVGICSKNQALKKFAFRICWTEVLILVLASAIPDSFWHTINPAGDPYGAVLICLGWTVVIYLMLFRCWPWAPVPWRRKQGFLLAEIVIVVATWCYLDANPVSSLGPVVEGAMASDTAHCGYYQEGSWYHTFKARRSSNGLCPCEFDMFALDKNGQKTILKRWMQDCSFGQNLGNDGQQLGAPPKPTNVPSAPQINHDVAARLKAITEILQRTNLQPEVPIPEQYWRDIGVTPAGKKVQAKANALRLSDSQIPELLVTEEDSDLCGSSGCPRSIYGLRREVAGDGKISLKYEPLLAGDWRGEVYVLQGVTNGYKDLLVDGGDGTAVLTFDGTSYREVECFQHDHKSFDNIHPTDCKVWTAN